MTINLCACLIVLFGAFIGYDSPLTVTQMLWVNLIMDTFAAMALSSLPPDRYVLNERPRDPKSHIIDRKMLWRIVSMGLAFFAILAILWQYMHYVDIASVSDMISLECVNEFVGGSRGVSTMTGVEMGIYFSIFVLMQFWNLFNVKYFRTNRSLIGDIVDLFRNPAAVKESYNKYFLLIAAVILVGQVVIVTFAGEIFNVDPISFKDWLLIIAITSPVMLIPDVVRFIRK